MANFQASAAMLVFMLILGPSQVAAETAATGCPSPPYPKGCIGQWGTCFCPWTTPDGKTVYITEEQAKQIEKFIEENEKAIEESKKNKE